MRSTDWLIDCDQTREYAFICLLVWLSMRPINLLFGTAILIGCCCCWVTNKMKKQKRYDTRTTTCPILCHPMDYNPPGSFAHGFPRQEFWSRLPFPTSDPEIKPVSPASLSLVGRFFTTEPLGKPFPGGPTSFMKMATWVTEVGKKGALWVPNAHGKHPCFLPQESSSDAAPLSWFPSASVLSEQAFCTVLVYRSKGLFNSHYFHKGKMIVCVCAVASVMSDSVLPYGL